MGFKTYSANPKTKDGAAAINRSAAAGHGRTLNVHRESKGESIQQNANWLATGQKPRVPAAVSRQRYQQRKLKQQQQQANGQNDDQKPAKKPTVQQKPDAPAKTGTVADGKAANAVNGQDLAGKFQFDNNSRAYSIEQVIKAQGFDGKPTVTNNLADFTSACQASNFIAKRGVGATDQRTLSAYDYNLKNGEFYVKCSGGSVHGYGMYAASIRANGTNASSGIRHAESTARSYAGYSRPSKVYTMTLDSSAKIGNEATLKRQMRSDTEYQRVCSASKMRSYYTMDVGVYAAYKGYDAYVAGRGRNSSNSQYSDYTVILNRSKVIIYDGV